MIKAEYELMHPFHVLGETRKMRIGDHTVHYFVGGNGSPLVLIHGLNIGWGQWYANIAFLAKHFTVYALDLPGSGGSSSLDYQKSDLKKDYVDLVGQFIIQNNLTDVYLLGHSFGGWIAAKVAIEHPNLVKKLILVAPLGLTSYIPFQFKLITIKFFSSLLSKLVPINKKNLIQIISMLIKHSFISDEFIEYYYESLMEKKHNSHPFLFMNSISQPFRLKKELSFIKDLPTLSHKGMIILGKNDRMVVFKKISQALSIFPHERIKILDNCGHVPQLEVSTLFHDIVVKFFEEPLQSL